MTVRFEFTLSDEDAEVLFDCIERARLDAIDKSGPPTDPWRRRWLRRHAEYLKELAGKLTNTRVAE